jgi:hypothetical protein
MIDVFVKPKVYVYQEINKGKYKGVKHFELKTNEDNPILSPFLNVSKDRGFARSNPEYWLKKKEGNKWSKEITGLFKTQYKGFFHGDVDKKDLIIFLFTDNAETLTVYYFKDYYSNNSNEIIKSILNA